jgi:hypothetical protein
MVANIFLFRKGLKSFFIFFNGTIAQLVEHRTENPTAQVRILLVPQAHERRESNEFLQTP